MTLTHLSNEELLISLKSVCFEQRRLLGRLLLHLIEVDARRLHRRSACSSMFDFCTRRLGMSESEACRRIAAAKLVKAFPCLLDYLERGDINLTALLLLRDHFTTDNVHAVVAAVRGRSKREVLELIAARAPKPDVLPTITPLPRAASTPAPPSPALVGAPARIDPLAPTRHRLELTVSDEIRAKLERARDLMSHRSKGDLEAVLDKALDALLAKLEKDRPGDGIPVEVRRAVFARDGEQCTYRDAEGNRCQERRWLELDHIVPKARGGGSDASNLRVVCRAHNHLYAEHAFGREHVARQIYLRQRRNEDEDALEVVRRALTKMGFRSIDVRRAMTEAFPPATITLPPKPEMIRIALALLVP